MVSTDRGLMCGFSRCLLLAAIAFWGSVTAAAAAGWEHSAPPPGDPCLTNRFGRSWSRPIGTGYVFADGAYIDTPYVVEQRGYLIFINGFRTEGVDIRTVLPPAPRPPVTEDPGIPADLGKETSVHDLFRHPVIKAKKRYWNHMGLYGEGRVEAMLKMLQSLPCVAKAVRQPKECLPGFQSILVHDYQGGKLGAYVAIAPKPVEPPPPDEDSYKVVMRCRELMETRLKNNGTVFFREGRLLASYPGIRANARWQDIFRTFASDASPEEKVRRLKTLGFLPEHKRVESAVVFYPVKDFKASDQIWKRLSGDKTWTDGTAAVLHDMTNGWRRILPKFERSEVAEVDVAEPDAENGKAAVAGEFEQGIQAGASVIQEEEDALEGEKRRCAWCVLGGAGIAVIVLCGVWLGGKRG